MSYLELILANYGITRHHAYFYAIQLGMIALITAINLVGVKFMRCRLG